MIHPGRVLKSDAAVVAALLLLSGAGSVALGPDFSSDLRSYHFYNGYSFLAGRFERNILAGGPQTFFNPVMDALHYSGMRYLPARLFAFLLGMLHGANLTIVYGIARLVAPRGVAVAAVALAGIGPSTVMLLGSSSGDLLSALPTLAGLLLVVGLADGRVRSARAIAGRCLVAGACAGAAVGLKLTALLGVIGLAATLLCVTSAPAPLAACAVGGLLGFLLTGGFWMWRLFRLFGSPVFPLANKYFHSPMVSNPWVADTRWRALEWHDWLTPPFAMLIGDTARLQEVAFRDARLFVFLAVFVAWIVRTVGARLGGPSAAPLAAAEKALLAFVGTGYLVWLKLFYYGRYLAVVDLLVPIAIYVLLRASLSPRPGHRATLAFGALALAMAAWMRYDPRGWGRADVWRNGWFRVEVSPIARRPDTLVLIEGSLRSYLIPYFPSDVRFIDVRQGLAPTFEARIAREIRAHGGPMLYLGESEPGTRLAGFGLYANGPCKKVWLGMAASMPLCPLGRAAVSFGP
jgi:hypothetical protein